jgi:hypothetical protein
LDAYTEVRIIQRFEYAKPDKAPRIKAWIRKKSIES